MSEANQIARPYAKAAFDYAVDKQQLEQWSVMLQALALVISDAGVQSLLLDPTYNSNDIANLAFDVVGKHLDEYGKNFVKLLAEYDRMEFIPPIHQLFEKLKDEYQKVVEVEVVSAFTLSGELADKLKLALEKRYGCHVKLNAEVDKAVIGGALIKMGDKVIDGTALGKLNLLQNYLNAKERLCL